MAPVDPWLNFAAIVFFQIIVLLAMGSRHRLKRDYVIRVFFISMLLGVPTGILFDLLIGRGAGIFSYFLEQNLVFLILNGMLSYGSAVATAATFPAEIRRHGRRLSRRDMRMMFAGAILIGTASLGLRLSNPIGEMFCAGIIVIVGSEIVALLAGWFGPIARISIGDIRPFCICWIYSVLIGAVYEIANAVFPVWQWTAGASLPRWSVEFFVVVFGYLVLFYPMILAWQLLLKNLVRTTPYQFTKNRE